MTPEFARILSRAYRGGVDVSLHELTVALNLPSQDVLGSAIEVNRVLGSMGLVLTPAMERGNFEDRRALGTGTKLTELEVRELIADEEHRGAEFKSTLICDLRAFKEEPCRHIRSDGVTHSSLKTVCAFANSGGGILLIGVEDDLQVCGLEPDFAVTGFNRDRWENHFRSLMNTKFWQGRLVNSFVGIDYVDLDGRVVSLISVVGRSESTFLKHPRDDRYEFYIRQGNRSVSLDLPEFELHRRT